MTNLVNMLLFQGAWFACVAGAAAGRWWLGVLAAVPLVAHFAWAMRGRWGARRTVLYLLGFALVGAALEFAHSLLGTYAFAKTGRLAGCAWMAVLWMAFATTLPLSLAWLLRRPMWAALGGFVFGPLSFYAGARLGAISLPSEPLASLVALALVWAIAVPLAARWVFAPGEIPRASQPVRT